ncbi:MAG TPA: serine hydrolase [Vicinamibacterales bacterium]|nr:serine hydrolase [Vicinamibacterales bacterium]
MHGTLFVLLMLGTALAAAPLQPMQKPNLTARVKTTADRFDGELGVYAKHLATGETVALAADARFPTASVIKVSVLVEAFQQIEDGRLREGDRVVLHETAKVGGSGTLRELHDGAELTLADLLHLMIVVSDNTATNLLLEKVGTLNVNARMEKLGLPQTKIFRPTFRGGQADCCAELEREFGLGVSTPREMAALLELVATGRAVSAGASARMLAILRRQQDRNMIARQLPGDDDLTIASKSGTDEEKLADASGRKGHIRNDVAILTGKRGTYVLAIFARRVRDERWSVDNAALIAGAEISKAIYEAWERDGGSIDNW